MIELKKNTAVRSFPGATIERLENKINNLRPKVTLHYLCIYLLGVLVSDI